MGEGGTSGSFFLLHVSSQNLYLSDMTVPLCSCVCVIVLVLWLLCEGLKISSSLDFFKGCSLNHLNWQASGEVNV